MWGRSNLDGGTLNLDGGTLNLDGGTLPPCPPYNLSTDRPTRHQTLHHIRTVGPPVCSKVRRLNREKLEVLKLKLQKLLDLGVTESTESPYAS